MAAHQMAALQLVLQVAPLQLAVLLGGHGASYKFQIDDFIALHQLHYRNYAKSGRGRLVFSTFSRSSTKIPPARM